MQKSEIQIVWFKRDLRTIDHKPLFEASKTLKPILPIYVVENEYWKQPFSNKRHWCFIYDSLIELRKELKKLGQPEPESYFVLESNNTPPHTTQE